MIALKTDSKGGIGVDILTHNRESWNQEVQRGNIWTIPVSPRVIAEARNGRWSVLLTPIKPVPREWFNVPGNVQDLRGRNVLCLASGGGQQGPIFAAAGAEVTVFDNSPAQLQQDKKVAERDGLAIRIEQGDMRDLGRFPDETFDLIFHPVSNNFVDDVNQVWRECFRVSKKGGVLLSGFCNPIIYIFDFQEWDDHRNLVVKYQIPYSDLEQLPKEQLEARIAGKLTLEYGHSLADQIGGQIAAGFVINGFYEDTIKEDLLGSHIHTYIATRALKI